MNKDVTFTSLIAYNEDQSTGLLEVKVKKDSYDVMNASNTSCFATNDENFWKINQLRDMVSDINLPLFSKNWDDIKTKFYIDKVVNPASVDITKSQYEQARLRGKYLILRCIFNHPNKKLKLSSEFINLDYENSLR